MTKESFAKNILRLRKAKGWSQQKLADKAEVSYHTVFRAEAGTMPKIENLQKIAGALGVSESELLGNHPKVNAANLTPETLDAIREATKEAFKQSLEESKGLPNQFEHSLVDPKQDLINRIFAKLGALNERELRAILTRVDNYAAKRLLTKKSTI